MAEFKPMVKMMTTEPTVELKLKKGGSAHKKMKHGGDAGHKPMQKMMDGGIMGALSGATPVIAGRTAAPVARTPARPSLASRRRAMRLGKPAVSRVLSRTMKEGGESKAEHKAEKAGLEKVASKLKSHESKPASKAHAGLKKGGACYKDGGIINTEKQGGAYRNTKMHTAEYSGKSGNKTGDVKMGNAGGYKTGGVVKGNAGGYKKGGMACATGGVALGNAGGYKKGGAMHKMPDGSMMAGAKHGMKKGGSSKKAYANGGSVNDEGKAVSMPQGNKKPSTPVSISKLSGTFKKGGTVAEKKLQGAFKSENATAMKEAKAKLLDKYSPYQKAGGGQVSDTEYEAVMKAEKAGKKTMIDSTKKQKTEKKYPSGLTDSDIDKIISSKEVQEGMTHFVDKKRGGKVGK